MQADPIGFMGGMNFYVYVGNNPVNLVDPLGLRLQALGCPKEKKLIESWLDVLKNMGDAEITKRLKEIIDSPILFTVQFSDDDLYCAGQYKDYNVTLDKALMDPNQTDFFYTASNSKKGYEYYGGPDTIAHELLGHGFDVAKGDFRNNQQSAIEIANKVLNYLGKPKRY